MMQAKRAAEKIGMNVEDVDDSIDCQDCKISKAKQKKVGKMDHDRSDRPGERLCIDTSSMKTSKKNKRFWVLVEDQATCMKWCYFVRNKDDQVRHIIGLIKDINGLRNRKVRYIRCDNAGENKTLEYECRKEGLGITFEYTARNTPQQNGQVERSFATLYGKVRAMLSATGMTQAEKERYWIEAAATATKVDNLLIRKGETKGPYRRFYRQDPDYQNHLRVFGEKGVVTKKMGRDIKSKLEDRGQLSTFFGYARNHTGDTYLMKNDKTGEVQVTRDVVWTKGRKGNADGDYDLQEDEEEEIDGDAIERDRELEHEQNEGAQDEVQRTNEESAPRLSRELRGLQTYNKPGRLEQVHFCFNVEETTKTNEEEEPITFQQAWWHENSES